jgi:hypothetical protein
LVDSLKVLDPEGPIREADIVLQGAPCFHSVISLITRHRLPAASTLSGMSLITTTSSCLRGLSGQGAISGHSRYAFFAGVQGRDVLEPVFS